MDLAGLTVVTVEQAVAAPYASCRLADAGARVIKVERPEGDFARYYDRLVRGQSAYFIWLNRGKQSICLDLKSPDDRALLLRMIGTADVFIQNLRPGALDELGFGSFALRALHPRLITCDITGFGTAGPCAGLKAYDLIVQAEAGLCSITGDGDPARVGISVCDIAAGTTAHAGILQALFARERSGRGRGIQVCLFDSIADWMNVPLLHYLYSGREAARVGVRHPSIAPYGAFRCADDTEIILSIQNEREWLAFCDRVLLLPHVARHESFRDNEARVENRTALDGMIGEVFARLPVADAIARVERAGIAYGRLNSLSEAAVHPHLRFALVDTPAGEIRIIAPGIIPDDARCRLGAIPALGEHSEIIRAEYR